MPTFKQRLLALLATSRAANLPTVVTHVLVARMLADKSFLRIFEPRGYGGYINYSWDLVLPTMLAMGGCLFYIGGCLIGDAIDSPFDCEHRPERPIPKGILSARAILITGYLLICMAWITSCLAPLLILIAFSDVPLPMIVDAFRTGLAFDAFPPALIITSSALPIAIVCYGVFHKRMGPSATLLMALCRSLLVLWAASPFIPFITDSGWQHVLSPQILLFASATFLYTLSLSLVARNESNPNAKLPGLPLKLLLIVPPALLSWLIISATDLERGQNVFYQHSLHQLHLGLALFSLLYLAWCIYALTRLKHSIPAFVSAALAGFCLMDACFAALIGWQIALACLVLFLLALLLQRIAPAT